MNRVLLQLWEESTINQGIFSDGCSLHINEQEKEKYISSIYSTRTDIIPETYDRIVGGEIEVFVSDKLFQIISDKKTIKLSQVELRNLLSLEDIIYNFATI